MDSGLSVDPVVQGNIKKAHHIRLATGRAAPAPRAPRAPAGRAAPRRGSRRRAVNPARTVGRTRDTRSQGGPLSQIVFVTSGTQEKTAGRAQRARRGSTSQ